MVERPKFLLTCPVCGRQHSGKRMMFYAENKACSCGHHFSDEWMQQELEKYQEARRASKGK